MSSLTADASDGSSKHSTPLSSDRNKPLPPTDSIESKNDKPHKSPHSSQTDGNVVLPELKTAPTPEVDDLGASIDSLSISAEASEKTSTPVINGGEKAGRDELEVKPSSRGYKRPRPESVFEADFDMSCKKKKVEAVGTYVIVAV
jgi:hypothetical protein